MKVVFFYPDYREKIGNRNRVEFPPLGMLSVCAVVEKLGCDVSVVPISNDTDLSSIPSADVFAYSITASATYPYFLRVVPRLRRKARLHIAGNTHVSIFPENTLKELKLDAVFCGEAEETITDWFNSGATRQGIIRGKRVDVNKLPFPARHLLPNELIYLNSRIAGRYNNAISMASSRGCVNRCLFCAVQNRGFVRFRNMDHFKAELEHILASYPLCQGIVLLDENFTQSEAHATNIASILGEYGLPWECNSRSDTLTLDLMRLFVACNCQEVRLGIESGCQHLLDSMHKGINLTQVREIVVLAKEVGLPVKLYIMHGFPGENMRTTLETINFLIDLRPYIHRIGLYRFTPLPGSPIYSDPRIYHLDWSNYTIYDNNNHWFGTLEDFHQIEESYRLLKQFVDGLNSASHNPEIDSNIRLILQVGAAT